MQGVTDQAKLGGGKGKGVKRARDENGAFGSRER